VFGPISPGDLITVALIGGVVAADTTAAFQIMLSRPLVGATVIGYLLGAPRTGITFGALSELIWAFEVPVGGSKLFDSAVSSVVGAAIACFCTCHLGLKPAWSITLALIYSVPVGVLGTYATVAVRRLNAKLVAMAERCAGDGNATGVSLSHLLGVVLSYTRGFLVSFLGASVGVALLSMIGFSRLRWDGGYGAHIPILMASGLGCAALIARTPLFKWRTVYLAAGLISGLVFHLLY